MIAHLAGTLLEKHVQRLVVDVGGVGYDVQVPLSTFYAVGEPGTRVTLRIHTHVREDALQLFGFVTALELSLFQRLIAVSGIGPKVASKAKAAAPDEPNTGRAASQKNAAASGHKASSAQAEVSASAMRFRSAAGSTCSVCRNCSSEAAGQWSCSSQVRRPYRSAVVAGGLLMTRVPFIAAGGVAARCGKSRR